jgi:hypothetical protein
MPVEVYLMKIFKTKELLKIGLLVMFLSVVLLSTIISFNSDINNEKLISEPVVTDNAESKISVGDNNRWSKYVNDEYSISFLFPSYLTKIEADDSGIYDFFLRFEENNISMGKGVAMGIRKGTLNDEILEIKKNILQGGVGLVKEGNIDAGTVKGKMLEFKPDDEENFERRSFIIIEKDGYVYSLSTVPDQMQTLLNSIEFKN